MFILILISGSENDEINIDDYDYKMPSADKVLQDDVEFHLESNDSDNNVYDNDDDGFKDSVN